MPKTLVHKCPPGFSTVEIMVALTVVVLVIIAAVTLIFGSQSFSVDAETNAEALHKAQAMLEDARALSRQDFNALNSTHQNPAVGNCPVDFMADGIYCKQILVTQVSSSTKNVTSLVSWNIGDTRPQAIKLSTRLSVFTGGQTVVNNFHNAPCWFGTPTYNALNVGTMNYIALNFIGANGVNVVQSCFAAYNGDSSTFGSVTLNSDILIHGFNNEKGAGVFALYNEGVPGKNGLMLVIGENGITDRLRLYLVDQAGNVDDMPLQTVQLGTNNVIKLNNWYRLTMQVTVGSAITVTGKVFEHAVPTNPNSVTTSQLGATLTYSGSPTGVDPTGNVGIAGWSHGNSDLSASVTNFIITP